ncbi:hypothetical protein RFI_06462 [Reticulomyxa filosa]|uniref:Thiamine pyrophosphate enzyme TPP-binding domain-containing protein n=1 Tax=Reticulomyxa filosa TaxID=46433 RepID=X6NXP9_RETFI|nr:hypothetical protein RFI_06462 [Reticulomyxa filosa]|eukprot:ETO30658.1 hypothetical protein RFI_06462 [Reticulomyxa filosa]
MVQGKATTSLLADMGIPFEILPDYEEGIADAIEAAQLHFQQRNSPYCLLVRKRTFTPYKLKNTADNNYPLSREEALQLILANTSPWDAFIATTGFTSRELYELRQKERELLAAEDPNNPHSDECKDLLMVGSMGHASSIALGIALNKPSRNIVCLDGDGAMLMHMGIVSTIGAAKPRNLRHILLNNGAHDSVGQQPTTGFQSNLSEVAKACGYVWCKSVHKSEDIKVALKEMTKRDGPTFLEIRVRPGAKKDLGRPKESPIHNKKAFMSF